MSRLIGLSISGESLTLTVVDRRGEVRGGFVEPLEVRADRWWEGHPEASVRLTLAALERAVREGLVRSAQVAGIGICADHGLVLLDADLSPLSLAERLPCDEVESIWADGGVAGLLAALRDDHPRLLARCGILFSTLDYLRFRLTRAIATHATFAIATGLAPACGVGDRWDEERVAALGVAGAALPPIFTAGSKVGVLSAEAVAQSGISSGVWVNAGSTPVAAELLAAVEPVPGSRVVCLRESGVKCYRVVGEEELAGESAGSVIPLAISGLWYREDRLPVEDPRFVSPWHPPIEGQWTVDSRQPQRAECWRERPSGDVWYAWDCGGPSAGAAIQAGLAMGWWSDPRSLWRKRRAPIDYEDWYPSLSAEPGVPEGDDRG